MRRESGCCEGGGTEDSSRRVKAGLVDGGEGTSRVRTEGPGGVGGPKAVNRVSVFVCCLGGMGLVAGAVSDPGVRRESDNMNYHPLRFANL